MKKLFTILLGFCFILPAFAGNVRSVSNEAWLEHIAEMQSLRQQIMSLISKPNHTFEDRDNLAALQQTFADKKSGWDAYLVEVSEGKAEVKAADTTTATSDQPEIANDKSEHKADCGHCHKGRKHRKHCKKNQECKADKACKKECCSKDECKADKACKKECCGKNECCGKDECKTDKDCKDAGKSECNTLKKSKGGC